MVIVMAKTDSVSSRIRRLRRKRGLTQAELASKIHVSRETVRDWELDKYEPSCQILVRLSNFFNVSIDYILGNTNGKLIQMDHLSRDQVELIARLVHSMEEDNSRTVNSSYSLRQQKR